MRIDSGLGGRSADDSEFDSEFLQETCDFFRTVQSPAVDEFSSLPQVSLRCLLETATFFQCEDVIAEKLAIRLAELEAGTFGQSGCRKLDRIVFANTKETDLASLQLS